MIENALHVQAVLKKRNFIAIFLTVGKFKSRVTGVIASFVEILNE